jgi:hypothetical protein
MILYLEFGDLAVVAPWPVHSCWTVKVSTDKNVPEFVSFHCAHEVVKSFI